MGNKNLWTKEEIEKFEELYKEGKSFKEISKILGRTVNAINKKSYDLRLGDKYMRNNNPKFKAVYQDYDWCYERYINRRMSHQEMADECGVSLRVIQKWCVEKHKLHLHTLREYITLTDKQRELIMFSKLGDGHIDKRKNQPMFIVCHAENQKDYLYWKYDILKNLCNNPPTKKESTKRCFANKEYQCQSSYRLCTKILDCLFEIREMSRLDIIKQMNEFGLSILALDDGYRGNLWEICLAQRTQEEKDEFIKVCRDRFDLSFTYEKDVRYVVLNAPDSKKLDEIILRNIPNNLDIVQYKIINNNKIGDLKYVYVNVDNKNIGMSTYLKHNNICPERNRKNLHQWLMDKQCYRLTENEFINLVEEFNNEQ